MEITPHVDAIRAALEAVAGVEEPAAAVADRLSEAVAPAVHLQLLDMLSQVAVELTGQLPDGRVDLQLAGRDARLVYVDPAAGGAIPVSGVDDDSGAARLTLRMSDALKASVESAAAAEGQSTNAWLVAAAKRALDPSGRRQRSGPGQRITGYTQA